MKSSQERTVLLREYYNDFEANVALGLLRDNDIPCMLQSELVGGASSFCGSVMEPIRLLVFERDRRVAEDILNAAPEEME